MCRFVVQIKKATLNGSERLLRLTFVLCAPVSEVAWDCSSHFIKSLFFSAKRLPVLFSHPEFVKLCK